MDLPQRAYVEGTLVVYEHSRVELLREVFTWAYERSCDQFKAIAGALPEPDPFRLRYRAQIAEAVAHVVRARLPIFAAEVESASEGLVPIVDRQRFVTLVLEELRHLHEGNLARYRLRLSEYLPWKEMQS